MKGLLDFIGTPEGQGLLSAAFGGLAGARQGTPFNNIGRAGVSGLVGYNQARDQDGEIDQRKQRQKFMDLQLADMQQRQADAQLARDNEATFRASITSPQQQADVNNALTPAQFGAGVPTLGLSGAGPVEGGMGFTAGRVTPPKPVNRDDQQMYEAFRLGLINPMDYIAATNKAPTTFKLADGESLYRQNDAGGFDSVVAGKPKASDETSDVRNYQFAVRQGYTGSFTQFQLEQRRAGATNVTTTYGTPMEGVDPATGNRVFFRVPTKGGKAEILPDIAPVPDRVPEGTRNKIAENAVVQEKITKALELAASNPNSFGLKNVMGDAAMQRLDPAGVEARAFVADLAGQKIHDRSGAAVSVGESERLKPYVPSATDTPETVVKKLKGFKAEYEAMARELQSGGTIRQVDVSPTQTPVKVRTYDPANGGSLK